MTPIIPA